MEHVPALVSLLPTLMMLIGLAVAYYMYMVDRAAPKALADANPALYRFLLNKWYFDELYDFLFVRPAFRIGRAFWKGGDGAIIDGLGPDGVSARVLDVTRNVVRLQIGLRLPLRVRDADRRRAVRHLVSVRGDPLMSGSWILSGLLVLPLIGALLILILRGEGEATLNNARWIALWTTLITFVLSVVAWERFNPAEPGFQLIEQHDWFSHVILYKLGVDGISMPFVLLTTFLMPICIAASWTSIQTRVKEYMIAFLVLETLMIGVFVALDLVLFYLFFEGGLIPMFLIIGVWGGKRRVYAAFKFFLYTLTGSLLMLLAIMTMYWTAGTTDIEALLQFPFTASMQKWLWLGFFASFAVKMPMWPVHTWLPDAHVEAPTAGSVILAGILLKMGGYGFIRFSLPMFPDASAQFRAADLRPVDRRHRLHLAGGAGAGGHEEADRLFVGRPYGLRDDGPVRRQHAGRAGRGLPDGEPRPRLRRAVPLRRRRLRPHAHPRHLRLWRPGAAHAALRRRLHGVHAGQCRPAGHLGLHRRVPDPDRRLPGQRLGRAARDDRRHPVGVLRALSLSPRHLRRASRSRASPASSTCRGARSRCSRRCWS